MARGAAGWRGIGACFMGIFLLASIAQAGTLEQVRQRGSLRCGVSEVPGMAARDGIGGWRGFEVDLCRAVALAVLGSETGLEIVPLSVTARFPALAGGQVDVLNASATWTASRDVKLPVAAALLFYYDGQGFVANRSFAGRTLAEINTASICLVEGTTGAKTVKNYVQSRGLSWRLLTLPNTDAAWTAFVGGTCDLHTNDLSLLAVQRILRSVNADDYVLLPDLISREPIASFVRDDDRAWERLVRWTLNALILAEEMRLTAARVSALGPELPEGVPFNDIEVQMLLGQEGGLAAALGLDVGWGRRVIGSLGHYGEIFDRNLGRDSPFHLPRGPNRLWRDGGLLFALPFK